MLNCERTKLIYRYESWCAGSSGILETAGTTFLLLIAVRHFQAGSVSKALVAGAGGMGYYRWLLVVFAGAFGFAAWCLGRCPSSRLRVSGGTHPFRALRFARTNPRFGRTLVMWMFMGFGNLMMIPLRVVKGSRKAAMRVDRWVNWVRETLMALKIRLE